VTRRILAALFAIAGGLLGALLVTLTFAPAASAHATIVATDPVDGSRLATAPTSVTITFDESVGLGSGGYLRVVDESGRRVDTGAATHPGGDGSKITATLRPGIGDSTYTASFRIISADSHPVAGALRFIVGDGSLGTSPSSSGSAVDGLTSKVLDGVRVVSFAGLALLGGAWLMLTVWPAGRDDRRARALVWTGWWVSVAAALAELFVQGPYDAGTGLGDVTRWSLLDATLHTDFGVAHSLRLIALGILAVVLGSMLRWIDHIGAGRQELAGLLVVGIAITVAVSGHATAQHPRWLATGSDTLHLLAMSAWVGGLAYLLIAVLPRREPAELRRVLPVFSKVAYVSVTTLAITGTYQAWLGVGSWRALADTTYGRLVLLKVALLIGLIVLGNKARMVVARRWSARLPMAYAMSDQPVLPVLTGVDGSDEPEEGGSDDDEPPDGTPPEPAPVRGLIGGVLGEVILAAAVLIATGVLVSQPPGAAALAIADARPHTVSTAIGGGRTAEITVSSQRRGPIAVTISLGAGAAPEQLTATATLAAKQLGPFTIPLTAVPGSKNEYSASAVLFPSAGPWLITLNVHTSEFDSTVATATVALH
jgi:copper transport protein